MVRRVAGHGPRLERAEAHALREPHVGGEARGRDRRAPEPLAQREHALHVVEMIVRHRDPARAAARVDLHGHRVEVLRELGAGIDHPGRIAPDDPRVRARERIGAGVVGTQPGDVEAREPGRVAHRATSR